MKTFLTCAVTGSIHTPSMSPHLPITAQQIADEAVAAVAACAASVHLHARHPEDGRPWQSPEAFLPFVRDIAARCDGVVNLTTGGAPTMSVQERMRPALELKPEVIFFLTDADLMTRQDVQEVEIGRAHV